MGLVDCDEGTMNGQDSESESRQSAKERGPYTQDLEPRLRVVEGEIRELKVELKHTATKEYISERETSMFRWLVGILLAAGAAILAALIRTFVDYPPRCVFCCIIPKN